MPDPPAWLPEVADVAAYIRARTKVAGSGGTELGTFDENTRPTAAEVTLLIANAQRSVRSALSGTDPCSEELAGDAKNVVALRAAMAVEASYFPEQTRTDRSNFAQLKQMYDADLAGLKESVKRECGTGDDGADAGAGGQSPSSYFDDLPLLGRSTPTSW